MRRRAGRSPVRRADCWTGLCSARRAPPIAPDDNAAAVPPNGTRSRSAGRGSLQCDQGRQPFQSRCGTHGNLAGVDRTVPGALSGRRPPQGRQTQGDALGCRPRAGARRGGRRGSGRSRASSAEGNRQARVVARSAISVRWARRRTDACSGHSRSRSAPGGRTTLARAACTICSGAPRYRVGAPTPTIGIPT